MVYRHCRLDFSPWPYECRDKRSVAQRRLAIEHIRDRLRSMREIWDMGEMSSVSGAPKVQEGANKHVYRRADNGRLAEDAAMHDVVGNSVGNTM